MKLDLSFKEEGVILNLLEKKN